ncbi:hypothetical protein SMICM304S_05145 [Streptomyces microflavus]
MGFKRLLASMGAGGASVETELTEVNVVPGGVVQGEVRIQGGSVAQQIEGLSVGLQARVEVESGDQETKQNTEFAKVRLGGAFEVQAGAVHVVPFGLEIPWETPVTMFAGQHLRGMDIGVTTELEIARALDSGDLDPINVHPLPAQQAILDASGNWASASAVRTWSAVTFAARVSGCPSTRRSSSYRRSSTAGFTRSS